MQNYLISISYPTFLHENGMSLPSGLAAGWQNKLGRFLCYLFTLLSMMSFRRKMMHESRKASVAGFFLCGFKKVEVGKIYSHSSMALSKSPGYMS